MKTLIHLHHFFMFTQVRYTKISVIFVCTLAVLTWGIFSIYSTAKASFAGGRDNIYGCKILSSTLLRLVNATSSCNGLLETPVAWRVGPEDGTEFPFVCGSCQIQETTHFQNRNMTNMWVRSANLSGAYFDGTNLTGADFQGAILNNVVFTGATLVGVNFMYADLTGSTGMASTTRSGIAWNNTICPDGTLSDDHGATCEGHF